MSPSPRPKKKPTRPDILRAVAHQNPVPQGQPEPERLEAVLVIVLALALAANGANSILDDVFAQPFNPTKTLLRGLFVFGFLGVGLIAFAWRASERVSITVLRVFVVLLAAAAFIVIAYAGLRLRG